jgi:hypothetical protein
MAKYVASKLQDNVYTIRCRVPECVGGLLELEHCRCILPQEVFDRWGTLCVKLSFLDHKRGTRKELESESVTESVLKSELEPVTLQIWLRFV